jgi:hypothetical protein
VAGPASDNVQDIGDYHFSAEDIEKVFIDARDWQKQFGDSPAREPPAPDEPPAVEHSEFIVDEPQGVEDITLEGVKVEIESHPASPYASGGVRLATRRTSTRSRDRGLTHQPAPHAGERAGLGLSC